MRLFLTFFILGLSLGFGPCIASCGPILISYIAATDKEISKALRTYFFFSLARITAYLILSLAIFYLGQAALEKLLGDFSPYLFRAGGIFIIFLGILIAAGKRWEVFKPCNFLEQHFLKRDLKSILLLGLITGFTPCLPLIAAFSYISFAAKTWANSLLYAFFFGLGTSLSPLIVLAMLTGLIPKVFRQQKETYRRVFNLTCGLIIVFLGLQLFIRAY